MTLKTASTADLDFGFKWRYYNHSNLSIEVEYVSKWAVNISDIPRTERYTLNASYAIAKGNLLSFSVGKDFDNRFLKSGNVVALMHALFGFGSERRVATTKPRQ